MTHLSIQCIWKMCWHLPNTAGELLSIRGPFIGKRCAITTREGLTERAIISREFTIRTARVVCNSTDTTEVFVVFLLLTQLPPPLRDSIPLLDDYFHNPMFVRFAPVTYKSLWVVADFKDTCFVWSTASPCRHRALRVCASGSLYRHHPPLPHRKLVYKMELC